MIALTLPMAPTINHAYGQRRNGGKFIKPAGIAFRQAVSDIVADAQIETRTGRIALFVAIYPATRRKQDLDNRIKALQDAMTLAGVYVDDEQIDCLVVIRREVIKNGKIIVVITEVLE